MVQERPGNLKRSHDLAAEALRYLAHRLSSPTNDEKQKARNELIRQKLNLSVEHILQISKRMDEFYQKLMAPGPWHQDPYIFSPLSDEEQEEITSLRSLICFALAVYADDLSQIKKTITTGYRRRNQSDEEGRDIENVDLQLAIIDDTMREEYDCG